MTGSIDVRQLPRDGATELTDVLVESFYEYPIMRFVLGDSPDYAAQLRTMIGLFVMARALRNEPLLGIYAGAQLIAAATVSDPNRTDVPPEFDALKDEVWDRLGGPARERYDRCVAVWQQLTYHAPQLHVNMIGVRRAHQKRGLARRLLEHVHELSRRAPDSTGVTLSTESPANVAFYEYLGYRVVGHAPITPELETWSFFRPDDDANDQDRTSAMPRR